uniref:Putative conserved secreted protein n=1 Tax=Aedes albopictus TaxID=7160 RepID=A0A1W7R772_AEDAL
MPVTYEFFILLAMSLLLVRSHPLPEEATSDAAIKCTLSEEDLDSLKSAISSAASAKSSDGIILSNETLTACPILANFTEMLKTVATDMEVLKTQSISNAEVELLRESFEERLNEITKNKDIFERQAGQETSKTEGQMVEKINRLQLEMASLKEEIEQETKKMYEDMAEYIFQRLKINDTDAIDSYAQIMFKTKMHDLFMKLKTDRWVLWKMLNYVEQKKDKVIGKWVLNTVINQVTSLNRNKPDELEIGKDSLVNLLCWTSTAKTVYGAVQEDQKMFYLTKLYFPAEKGCTECKDVMSRILCSNTYPRSIAKAYG